MDYQQFITLIKSCKNDPSKNINCRDESTSMYDYMLFATRAFNKDYGLHIDLNKVQDQNSNSSAFQLLLNSC